MSRLDRRSFAFIPLKDENETSLGGPAMDEFVGDVVDTVARRIRAKRRLMRDLRALPARPEGACTPAPKDLLPKVTKREDARDWIRLQ